MRGAAFLVLALAACSGGEPATEPAAVASSPAAAAAPQTATVAGTGSNGSGLRASVSDLSAETSGLNVRVTDTATVVDLPADALFAFDSAELSPDASQSLLRTADLIRQGGDGAVTITGHTDAKGDDAYNQQLSERRARAVADWFGMQPGVRQRRFEVTGRGEAEPVAPNEASDGRDDPAGRARNRRVEVFIPRA